MSLVWNGPGDQSAPHIVDSSCAAGGPLSSSRQILFPHQVVTFERRGQWLSPSGKPVVLYRGELGVDAVPFVAELHLDVVGVFNPDFTVEIGAHRGMMAASAAPRQQALLPVTLDCPLTVSMDVPEQTIELKPIPRGEQRAFKVPVSEGSLVTSLGMWKVSCYGDKVTLGLGAGNYVSF